MTNKRKQPTLYSFFNKKQCKETSQKSTMLESEFKKQENSITPVLDDFDELQEIWRKEFYGAKSEPNFQREKMCNPQTKFLATPLVCTVVRS